MELRVKSYNLSYGIVKLTTYFLCGLIHPNLGFTYETSKKRINFLHLNAGLRSCAISIDLYIKCTDGYHYLHYR